MWLFPLPLFLFVVTFLNIFPFYCSISYFIASMTTILLSTAPPPPWLLLTLLSFTFVTGYILTSKDSELVYTKKTESLSFWIWLTLLNIYHQITWKFYGCIFLWSWIDFHCILVCSNHNFIFRPSAEVNLYCFCFLALVSRVTVNGAESFWSRMSSSSSFCQHEHLGHTVDKFFSSSSILHSLFKRGCTTLQF